jgi:hypothetical protein
VYPTHQLIIHYVIANIPGQVETSLEYPSSFLGANRFSTTF